MTEPVWKGVIESYNRGIKSRYITEITSENAKYCKELMKYVEVRHLEGAKGNFAIADKRELQIHQIFQDQKPPSQAIYTNVKEQQFIFENFWNKAIPAADKIQEIEQGITPDFIETVRDSVKIQNLQSNLINSAEKEILIIFPTVNIFHQQEGTGLIVSLQNLLKRKGDLMIRILTPIDEKIDHVAHLIRDQNQQNLCLQYIVQPLEVTVLILVIDRKYSLSIEIKKEDQYNKKWANVSASTDKIIGLATYSNSKSTVLSYASIFESLWRQDELYQQLEKSRDQIDEMKQYLNQVLKEVKHIRE